jgi:hypothetical protein
MPNKNQHSGPNPAEPEAEPVETSDSTSVEEATAAVHDEPVHQPNSADKANPSLAQGLKQLVASRRVKAILAATAVLLLGTVALGATDAKYAVLGVVLKSEAEVTVVDTKTKQPIPRATVMLAGASQETDNQGKASFKRLQPGITTLEVSKKAYRTTTQKVKLTFRRPKIEPVNLQSSGIEVSFDVTDKISGQPLDGAEIKVDEDDAISKDGKVLMSLLPRNPAKAKAKVTAKGYLEAEVDFEVRNTKEPHKVTLVPEGKVYFLSNRTGKIDLYESNLDGSNLQIVLAGTGYETSETGVLLNVTNPSVLAIAANRDNQRAGFTGYSSDLFLFNTSTRKLTKLEEGYPFYYFRAWLGDYLVYVKDPTSAPCPNLKAYHASAGNTSILAEAGKTPCPQVNLALKDLIFYSVTDDSADGTSQRGLFVVKPTGEGKRRIDPMPANSVARQAKQTLLAEYYNYTLPPADREIWRSINLTDLSVTKLSSAPSREAIRGYIESPGGKFTTFIEERDGKTELYVTDSNGDNERKLTGLGSVNQFVQWIGDSYIVFSSTKSDENALYVVSVNGGTPQKIADFYRGNSRTYSGGYNPVY